MSFQNKKTEAWKILRKKAYCFNSGAQRLLGPPEELLCAYYLAFMSVEVVMKAALSKRGVWYPRDPKDGGHDLKALAAYDVGGPGKSFLELFRAEKAINSAFTTVTSMAWQMQYRYEREVPYSPEIQRDLVIQYGELFKWIMNRYVQQ